MSFPFVQKEQRAELPTGIQKGDSKALMFFISFVLAALSSMGLVVDHAIRQACGANDLLTVNMAYDPESFIRPPPNAKEASLQGFSETVIPSWGYVYFRDTDVIVI